MTGTEHYQLPDDKMCELWNNGGKTSSIEDQLRPEAPGTCPHHPIAGRESRS